MCVVCGHRSRADAKDRPPPVGLLCARCGQRFRDDLDTIVTAWQWLAANPGTPAGTNSIGGADPNLPGGTGRLSYLAGGATSPLGRLVDIAGTMHAWLAGAPVRVPVATLPLVAAAVRADFDAGGHSHPDIHHWALTLAYLAAEGRDLSGTTEQGQWVTCPNPDGDTVCGRRLRIDVATPTAPVVCRKCDRVWTSLQLLNLAVDSEDAWADPQSAADAVGVTVDQVNRWVRGGRVRAQHSLVLLSDVRTAKADGISDGTRRLMVRLRVDTVDPRKRCGECGEWIEAEAATIAEAERMVAVQLAEHRARHAQPARRA